MTALLSIRPMKSADLDQVIAIDQASFSLPWPKNAFTFELQENPLSMAWVAEIQQPETGQKIIGMIIVWLILDEAHIATIAVHQNFRGQSIAKKLLAAALDAAIQKGMISATLEVRAGNKSAQALYKNFGFQIVGQRYRYYQDNGEDALVMTASNLNQAYLEWLRSCDWEKPKPPCPADEILSIHGKG